MMYHKCRSSVVNNLRKTQLNVSAKTKLHKPSAKHQGRTSTLTEYTVPSVLTAI